MKTVNVHKAKAELSRLLEKVERGEQVIITRSGKPVAKLVPYSGEARRPGRLKGKIRIRRDFDAPLPSKIAAALGAEDN